MYLHGRTEFIGRYTLSDLFDRTFKMVARTWRTSLGYSVALYVPVSFLMALTISHLFGTISDLVHLHLPEESAGTEILIRLAPSIGWMLLLALVAGLGQLFVNLAVGHNVAIAAGGMAPPPAAYARITWKRSFWPVVLQGLIKVAAVFAVMVAAVILGGIGALLSLLSRHSGTIMAIAIITAYIIAIAAILALSVYLFFGAQAVVFDRYNPYDGLVHSVRLVRGGFWRVLGISLLISMMFSFAMGLITTPIITISLLPAISQAMSFAADNSGGGADASLRMLDGFRGMSGGIGVAMAIQGVATTVFYPVFYGLFYIDLKFRRGELPPPLPASEPPASEPPAPVPPETEPPAAGAETDGA